MGKLTKEEIKQNEEAIIRALKPYQGKTIYCPALGANVLITHNSIKETSHHAAFDNLSAKMAIRISEAVRNAKFECLTRAKANGRQQSMGLSYMFVLKSHIRRLGVAKVTIGLQSSDKKLLYCVTAIEKDQ